MRKDIIMHLFVNMKAWKVVFFHLPTSTADVSLCIYGHDKRYLVQEHQIINLCYHEPVTVTMGKR